MNHFIVVQGEGTDIIVRGGKGVNAFTQRYIETTEGDLVFVLDTVARVYSPAPEVIESLYSKHKTLQALEGGFYTPRDNLQFITRGLNDAIPKWCSKMKDPLTFALVIGDRQILTLVPNHYNDGLAVSVSDYLGRFNAITVGESLQTVAEAIFSKHKL